MTAEKNTNLSLRLEETLLNKIEFCASLDKKSKSDFIRNALIDSTKYTEVLPLDVPKHAINFILTALEPMKLVKVYPTGNKTSEIDSNTKKQMANETINIVLKYFHEPQSMVFSNEAFKIVLNVLTPPQIEQIALKIFQSDCKNIYSSLPDDPDLIDFISTELIKNRKFIDTFYYGLKYLTYEVISPKGRNWFERCQVTHSNDIVTFVGKHSAGKNFSIFFMHYYEQMLSFIPSQRHEEPLLSDETLKITHKLLVKNDQIFDLRTIVKRIGDISKEPSR